MIDKVLQDNNNVAWMVSDYLSMSPRAVTRKLLEEVDPGRILTQEQAYGALLAGFCGAQTDDEMWYFTEMVHKRYVADYISNPYFREVCFPDIKVGQWEITRETYAPYEAFPCGDIAIFEGGREVPQLGYFEDTFSFPVIKQDGREWMALKPNEIETMKEAIEAVSGDVAVFGLGLGYFTFMAARKDNVRSVTVIERDESAIQIFEEMLLPQFRTADKIRIVKADAFEYLESGQMSADSAFVDLWHDSGDGPALYVRSKQYEARYPSTRFHYWIEESLRSALRWMIAQHKESQKQA